MTPSSLTRRLPQQQVVGDDAMEGSTDARGSCNVAQHQVRENVAHKVVAEGEERRLH